MEVVFRPKPPIKLLMSSLGTVLVIPLLLILFQVIDRAYSKLLMFASLVIVLGVAALSLKVLFEWSKKKALIKGDVLIFAGLAANETPMTISINSLRRVAIRFERAPWGGGIPIKIQYGTVDIPYLDFYYIDDTHHEIPLHLWDTEELNKVISNLKEINPNIQI